MQTAPHSCAFCQEFLPLPVSFQESLPTPPRPSAAPPPVTRRVLPAASSEEKKAVPAPARDASIKTPGRETSRQKATSILQNTRSQVEPCPGNAEENCNDDQHDCAETAPSAAAEESHAGPARTPSETHSTGVGSTAPRCVSKPSADPAEVVAIPEDVEPEFQTPKERECWQLYRRMMEKGVSVSYDTVLRGLLTPTEYRLRRTC
ncbi:uncharacterized protein LOC110838856 [Zootermopsis nevadensis]|uniref:uncharacterized protein LOC110838856 n=1 Tax=Zootermopsis nevadensis TaxID=136037 RepID=UPI000B8E5614|nr:uncharacterized protein LOC110838856 [Zootermopsis nevadensis]